MAGLDALARPWSGIGVRHIPANSRFGVLDLRFAGRSADNRWNYRGEPTLYLASDRAVALAEFARHFEEDRSPGAAQGAVERAVFRLALSLEAVLDLRTPEVQHSLSLRDAPGCFLDREIARATAAFLRRTTSAQALFVPSMAFLDDPERWVLVVFLDKLPTDPAQFVSSVEPAGGFRVASI